MGVVRHDWEPIKAMFVAGKSAREISLIFKIHPATILNKSKAESWGALRRQVRSLPPPKLEPFQPKIGRRTAGRPKSVPRQLDPQVSVDSAESRALSNENAINRALRIRSSDQFREKVIGQADSLLDTLGKQSANNVFEIDRYAEALTKLERIGARAYGYDREGDRPIINIGILGTGSEYEPV